MRAAAKWLVALALAPAAALAQEPPQGQFTEKVEVRVRSAIVSITDASGKPLSRPPAPNELRVLEDGHPLAVIAVEPLRKPEAAPPPNPQEIPAAPAGGPVQVPAPPGAGLPQYLYVDPTVLVRRSTQLIADAIAHDLVAILRIGPLEVVVADPQTHVLLPSSEDPARIRAALARVAQVGGGANANSIVEKRKEVRRELERSVPNEWRMLMRDAIREEILLLDPYFERLSVWASSLPDGPGVFYLCSDGFDSDPSEMYRALLNRGPDASRGPDTPTEGPPVDRGRDADELLFDFGQALAPFEERVSLALAGHDLRVVAIAPSSVSALSGIDVEQVRTSSHAIGVDTPYLMRPQEPLRRLADATGGEVVVTPQRLAAAVDRLAGGFLVSFRSALPPDGKPHALEVVSARGDWKIQAQRVLTRPTPEASAAARAIRSLAGGPGAGGLEVSASVTPRPAKGKRRTGRLQVTANLRGLAAALESLGSPRVRVTVVVSVRRSEPFVQSEEFDLASSQEVWEYEAPLEWPPEAERVSVTVEELRTGTHGEAVVDLPGRS